MMSHSLTRVWRTASLVIVVAATTLGAVVADAAARTSVPHPGWVAAWGSPSVRPGVLGPGLPLFLDGTGGHTVRDVVHLTLGGARVRVRLSNFFGTQTAVFTDVRVALRTRGAATRAGTSRRVHYAGSTSVRIAPGRQVASDPVALRVRPGDEVAISLYAPHATGVSTLQGSLNHTNYLSGPGDRTAAVAPLAFPTKSPSWYWLGGVDVLPPSAPAHAIVALGDSITAGYDSTLNANRDWVDLLADRLHSARRTRELSLVNAGIAGNNLHEDSPCYGESALHRMARDVLAQPGVRYVIVDEGVNDITHPTEPPSAPLYSCLAHRPITAAGMISLFTTAAKRIHAAHLRAIGVTLSPFGRYAYWTAAIEAERQRLNRWIRSTRTFDGIIDFDRVLRDPRHPAWMNPRFDGGDGLHPNDLGHRAMTRAIDLSLFTS